MYNYRLQVRDISGNKMDFTTKEPNQYDAEMLAEEWATQGGVEVDSITVVETDDPDGIIDTGNW